MNNITFTASQLTKVIFGKGKRNCVPELINQIGEKGLILTGRNTLPSNIVTSTFNDLDNEPNYKLYHKVLENEPNTIFLDKTVEYCHEKDIDFIIAVGGGRILDAGKIVSALVTNGKNTSDYIKQLGNYSEFTEKPIPCITIPTLPGTGSEVSHSAVISVSSMNRKFMISSELLSPVLSVIDPELTYSTPHSLTAISGLSTIILVLIIII